MSQDITAITLAIAGIIAGYYIVLFLFFKSALAFSVRKDKNIAVLPVTQAKADDFPQLIDRPAIESAETLTVTLGKRKETAESDMEMVSDDESVLLKAAEVVVEKVQDVVNHIASNPPNLDEVFSKIRAIVNQYRIFHNTEYFEAINSFIAVTVERDCAIKFTKDELLNLWK